MGALLGMQAVVAALRIRFVKWKAPFENEPFPLMKDGEIITKNMQKFRVTEADLRAELRETNLMG